MFVLPVPIDLFSSFQQKNGGRSERQPQGESKEIALAQAAKT
jgi:hypothetical protein